MTFSSFSSSQDWLIGERTSFNSEKQATQSVSGLAKLNREFYVTASLQYGVQPGLSPKSLSSNYGGYASIGYIRGPWGVDASYAQNSYVLTGLTSRSAGGGITFALIPGLFETGRGELDVLKAAHMQNYETELTENRDPLFWVRLGGLYLNYRSNLVSSDAASGGLESLNQYVATLDGHAPILKSLIPGVFVKKYSYSLNPAGYANAVEALSKSDELKILAQTFRELPSLSAGIEMSWQFSDWDSFIPRVQTSLIEATKQWETGGSLTWRRRLTKSMSISPTYELLITGADVVSGAAVDFLYQF